MARPRRQTLLDELTIKEVFDVFQNTKTYKVAAKTLKVTDQELSYYRAKHKKELDQLAKEEKKRQADIEMGLIIEEDKPVIKLIEDKKITDLKEEIERLNKEIDMCEQVAMSQAITIKNLETKNETLQKKLNDNTDGQPPTDVERLKADIERLKKQKQEAVDKQRETTAEFNERSRKYETSMRAATLRIQQLEGNLKAEQDKAVDVLKKVRGMESTVAEMTKEYELAESHHAEQIVKYERERKELQEQIDTLTITPVESPVERDNVNSPSHYNAGSIEVIDIIEQITAGYDVSQAYNVGNVIKYVARSPHKGSQLEDLQKAAWYLDRVIKGMGVAVNA